MLPCLLYRSATKRQLVCILFLQHSSLYNTNTLDRSSFLFVCLLLRRCSLSFRNLLSCHTVSRVCHCQSHSNKQSANIDYRILETFGCSLGYILKAFHISTVENNTVRKNTFSPTQTIHLSVYPSIHPSVCVSCLVQMTMQQPTVDKSDDRLVIRIFQKNVSLLICIT